MLIWRDAVVSTACSSSPKADDTASRTNPPSPSMAVPALPSCFTWGLSLRVLDTTDLEAPGLYFRPSRDDVSIEPDHAS